MIGYGQIKCMWPMKTLEKPYYLPALFQHSLGLSKSTYEPPHEKTNKMSFAPSEDPDQPGHPPSLISVFAVRTKKAFVPSYPLSTQWVPAGRPVILLVLSWGHSIIIKIVKSSDTQKTIAVILPDIEECGFTIEQCVEKLQMEMQTV